MAENFKFELVKPDQFVFSSEVSSVKIPCYEGEMTILRDHISLITFLRPGIVEIDKQGNLEKYYIEEGTVEFNNNNLLVLTSTAEKLVELDKNKINQILADTEKKLNDDQISDKEKYFLTYKASTLKQLS
ncbi:MAG: ATP synthase F1 subunit epsilon [Pseudomonadota bacterium]|nr:ATP synthase F1 subunit epsilon [Pseudomonadota bacterium]|tara:strand:+ start:59 stop:448 length:390 start_codon:yes stop_codon:yes gene_type:complete